MAQAVEELVEIFTTKWGKVHSIKNFKKSMEDWLNQFEDKNDFNEREVAIKLLSNLNYYNNLKISEICYWLYNEYEALVGNNLGYSLFFPILSQTGRLNHSYDILRKFEEATELDRAFFVGDIEQVSKNYKGFRNVVMVDDVSGSGKTITDCIKYLMKNYKQLVEEKKFYILLIEITEEAHDRITKFFINQGIEGEILYYNKHKRAFTKDYIFSEKEYVKARELIEKLETKIVGPHTGFVLGYDKSQCLLSFSYGPPNNTLPIFWFENEKWSPLFLSKNGSIKPKFQTKFPQKKFNQKNKNKKGSYKLRGGK